MTSFISISILSCSFPSIFLGFNRSLWANFSCGDDTAVTNHISPYLTLPFHNTSEIEKNNVKIPVVLCCYLYRYLLFWKSRKIQKNRFWKVRWISLCLAGDKGVAALKGDKPPQSCPGESNYGPSTVHPWNHRKPRGIPKRMGGWTAHQPGSKPLNFSSFHHRIFGFSSNFVGKIPTPGGKIFKKSMGKNMGGFFTYSFCQMETEKS